MTTREWFDLIYILSPLFLGAVYITFHMWRDDRRQTRLNEAVLRQTTQSFSNQDTVRVEK